VRVARQNVLRRYFDHNNKRLIFKWDHYFEIYDQHLRRFRRRPVTVLEFGVFHGGSLQMWRKYFGRRSRIYGVDINPTCKRFEGRGITVFIGDQEDRAFLRRIARKIGPIDVVIDDGGHTMAQQIATFEVLYPRMSENGCYLTEDVHTSYMPKYGGGLRREGTFMEYAKALTDKLNAWYVKDGSLKPDKFTRSTRSVHFYDSIVVFERGRVRRPTKRKSGVPQF
jgi:hypothetical protein